MLVLLVLLVLPLVLPLVLLVLLLVLIVVVVVPLRWTTPSSTPRRRAPSLHTINREVPCSHGDTARHGRRHIVAASVGHQ